MKTFQARRNKSWKKIHTVIHACFCHSVDDLFSLRGLGRRPVGQVCATSHLFPSSLELTLSTISATHLP